MADKLDRSKILHFTNVVAQLGRATLAYKEGLVAFRMLAWTLEQVAAEEHGRGPVTEAEAKLKLDELIGEVEGG